MTDLIVGQGQYATIAEAIEAASECSLLGWDGYDAAPVSEGAARRMGAFLNALPGDLPRPSIGADPHGHLSAEWYRGPDCVLSVGVGDDDQLWYAGIFCSENVNGVVTPDGHGLAVISDMVRRIRDARPNRKRMVGEDQT